MSRAKLNRHGLVYFTTVSVREQDHVIELQVCREPWWTAALSTVADQLCTWTYRRTTVRFLTWSFELSDRHTETWSMPISSADAADFCRWRGWNVFWTDDESDTAQP